LYNSEKLQTLGAVRNWKKGRKGTGKSKKKVEKAEKKGPSGPFFSVF
jgi:hypothetical protein